MRNTWIKTIVCNILLLLFAASTYAQNAELDALLDAGIEGLLDAEIVSASKSRQRLDEVPAYVQVVTQKEIKERGYQTIEDLLSDLPGFQFRNIQGFNSYVFQRGIASQNNLILLMIDGVQVNELNSGGFYGGGQYLMSNIAQVEIVYGPASALYGTNAISGIINLITKKETDSQGAILSASYGSFNTYALSGGYGYNNTNGNYGYRVSGQYYSTQKTPLSGIEGDNNWGNDLENFEHDVSIDLTGHFKQFSLIFNVQDKRASRATNYRSEGTHYLDNGTLWNIRFLTGQIQYNYTSEKYNFTPRLYYRNSSVRSNTIAYVTDTSQVGYFRPGNLVGIDLLNQYQPFKPLNIIGGVSFENENLAEDYGISQSSSSTEKPAIPPHPSMMNNNLISAYLQSELKLVKSVTLTTGLRYDYSSYYGEILTPRVSIAYNRRNFSSRLNYNEAFRAPKPWDFVAGAGNSGLKPEKIKSAEWINSIKLSGHLLGSVTLYRNYLENIISTQTAGGLWYRGNSGKITTDGLEFEFKIRKQNFTSWVNYTYNYSIDNDKIIVPEISKHMANAGFQYYPVRKFNFGLRGNYTGKRKNASLSLNNSSGEQQFPDINPSLILHFSAGYSFSEYFDCSLYINNILDTKYYHTSNRPPDRYAQAERSIRIELRYKIQ